MMGATDRPLLSMGGAHHGIVFINDGNDFLGSVHMDETILTGSESVKRKGDGYLPPYGFLPAD